MAAMPLIDSELTGIGVIDEQHQDILDLVTSLGDVAQSGDRGQIELCINRIVSQTLAHFEFEEELMAQAGYEFIKVHKRLHDHFIQRLASYTQRFDNGEDVIAELEPFLSSWLYTHFSHEDKDYSPGVLAEMQGLADNTSGADEPGWFKRTLGKIA